MSSFVVPQDSLAQSWLQALRNQIAALGQPVQYQPGGPAAAPQTVLGIWRDSTEIQGSMNGMFGTLLVCLADLSFDPAKGDLITKDGHVYQVADASVDGRGRARLYFRSIE